MARAPPPAPASGQPASEALPGEQDTPAVMLGQGGVADRDDAFGTKTLAQLREEAIQQRRNAMEALMPERAALLKELYFLLTDTEKVALFGAGSDPTAFSLDPAQQTALQEKTAAFIERWIREPRVAAQIPLELPPLKPTPPLSPTRRDSTMLDMSEEVAAVERELIKPEYRKHAASGSTGGNGNGSRDRNRTPSGQSGSGMAFDGQHNPFTSPTRDGASSTTSHKRQQSLVSPFPITFHSPGFSASTPPLKQAEIPFPLTLHQSTTSQEASTSSPHAAANVSISVDNEEAGPSSPPKAKKAKTHSTSMEDSDALPLKSFPVPYPPELPPLPDYVLKNRMNVGGLAKKKARDRAAAQQNPQLASTLATSADLYKLGVSKAVHSSIRSLVGAGAPPSDKSRTGGKVLSTADWHTVISELQSQRAMERIEQLKAEKTWSLRQFGKQRPPATHKAHWDYLLEEMTWMATDFRQETRWKAAAAYEVARAVKSYHKAKTDEERSALQISVRPPTFLPDQTEIANGTSEEDDVDMVTSVIPNSPEILADTSLPAASNNRAEAAGGTATEGAVPATDDEKKDIDVVKTPAITDIAALPAAASATEPRHKKYQHQLLRARAPLFDLSVNATVFDLSKAGLPDAYKDVPTYDLTNELFQELMSYGPPAEPSTDSRQNRRIDESNPIHTRITNPSHILQRKPILVSTLQPARKRKPSGAWGDLTDVAGDEGRDLLTEMFGPASDIAFAPGMRVKDSGNKRFTPLPPANAEARAAAINWTPEEDKQLFIFARQYSFNWDLIASVFNDATHRFKYDERLPWDCYDRWHKKYAPLPTPATGQTSAATALPPTTAQATTAEANGQQLPGQTEQQAAQAQAGLSQQPQQKKEKRAASATLASSTSASVPIKRPELSKAQIRHMSIIEATKKAQKKREMMQKNNMQPPIRKINLNAHESHNQPMHPGLTALDLSRLKAERERQQLEEIRKREQAKMYQQVQAAAMAQQQMQAQAHAHAQAQAQAQAQQQGGQSRGPIPQGMPGQPMPGGPQMQQLPPGAIPQNMLPNQPGMPGHPSQQRIPMGPPQLPPGMQMPPPPMPQQGERARSMSQQHQAPRPPSQSGQHPQQQIMMNGQQQPPMMNLSGTSPPMQANLLPGMQYPMQPMQQNGGPATGLSQSPQPPSAMPQLSPHQIQLQLQRHQNGNPQMSPAQQQALLAQLSQMRAGSPAMPMPGGYPAAMPAGMQGAPQLLPNLQANQQQLLDIMRMRQNSQASSQGSVQ